MSTNFGKRNFTDLAATPGEDVLFDNHTPHPEPVQAANQPPHSHQNPVPQTPHAATEIDPSRTVHAQLRQTNGHSQIPAQTTAQNPRQGEPAHSSASPGIVAQPGIHIDPNHDSVTDHHLVIRHGTLEEYDSAIHEPVDQQGFLNVHSIVKSFKKRTIVRGVSLSVRRGEAVGLLGPNGAGKTTIFYMITGLIPADKGSISIDGADVTRMPMYRRARLGIGYLPQEASIFRGLTVEQNINAVLELVERNKKERARQLDALLEEFHITHLRKSPSIALSGGERRRVEIARSLASRPSYMLLDEPFAGIDPIAIKDIRALVRHLTQRGIGVLITDHNVRETLSLIDRAYIIYDGHVLMEGNPDEIANNEDVRRVYLGDEFNL